MTTTAIMMKKCQNTSSSSSNTGKLIIQRLLLPTTTTRTATISAIRSKFSCMNSNSSSFGVTSNVNNSCCSMQLERSHHNHHHQRQHLQQPFSSQQPYSSLHGYRLEAQQQSQSPHHNNSQRYFSTRGRKKKKNCPYQTLGVSEDIEYKLVKKAFLKIAMTHHPDTAGHDSPEEKHKAKEIFIRARTAFEKIVELPCGGSGLKEDHSDVLSEDFDSWFKEETGLNPFDLNLDPDTLKEVADVSANQAGLDRGGMWHMAQALTQGMNTSGIGGGTPLKLSQGTIKQKDGTTKIRRIRRQ